MSRKNSIPRAGPATGATQNASSIRRGLGGSISHPRVCLARTESGSFVVARRVHVLTAEHPKASLFGEFDIAAEWALYRWQHFASNAALPGVVALDAFGVTRDERPAFGKCRASQPRFAPAIANANTPF